MPEPENLDDRGYSIRAVERTCDILDMLAAANAPVGLNDLASACDMPKTSAFRYLATLTDRKYVERTGPNGDYRLGSGLAALRVDRYERLARVARPRLESLRDEFGETANLGMLVGAEVAYLEIVESPHSVRLAARKRDRDAIHCTALGKAITAAMPDSVVSELAGSRYARRTANTIMRWTELKKELQRVRELGYALDDEENELGGRCVAVRVPGQMAAAISISAISARLPMKAVPGVARRLRDVASDISSQV